LKKKNIDDREVALLMAGLNGNRTLITLNLFDNKIALDGARAMAFFLRANETLEILNLGRNWLRDPGVSLIAGALTENTALQHLQLEENDVYKKGVSAINQMLQQNTTLQTLRLKIDYNFDGINASLLRNRWLFQNEYWHIGVKGGLADFGDVHEFIMTTLLCNRTTGGPPALPMHLWIMIFSFWRRNDFIFFKESKKN
jgi:hypothetical protein